MAAALGQAALRSVGYGRGFSFGAVHSAVRWSRRCDGVPSLSLFVTSRALLSSEGASLRKVRALRVPYPAVVVYLRRQLCCS